MAIRISGTTGIDMGNAPVSNVKSADSSNDAVTALSTNITVDVGAGQTYTTINQALGYLSGFYPMYKQSGITATINLKAGFVMAEQVLVSGIDLGWITITGVDAETVINHTALTTDFTSADYGFASYPAFGVSKGGVLPRINQLFNMNLGVSGASSNKHGVMAVGAGSSADIMNGKGVKNAGTIGIYATYSSTINATNANASGAGTYGIYAGYSSTINAERANASSAGQYGIIASRTSTINALNALVRNQSSGLNCIAVLEGSMVDASGIDNTGSTVPAFNQAVNTLTGNGIIYQ